MTVVRSFTCDYCSVVIKSLGDDLPLGWWPVPEKGANGTLGHCCAECFTGVPGSAQDVIRRRHAQTEAVLSRNPHHEREERDASPVWPARRSPFGGSDA